MLLELIIHSIEDIWEGNRILNGGIAAHLGVLCLFTSNDIKTGDPTGRPFKMELVCPVGHTLPLIFGLPSETGLKPRFLTHSASDSYISRTALYLS